MSASTAASAGQVATASLMSLAHGTNDAQKTMGVIFLALVASGSLNSDDAIPCGSGPPARSLSPWEPTWAAGASFAPSVRASLRWIPRRGGCDGASAAIILTSSHFGMALSTTHVASGPILGSGLGRKGAEVPGP